MPWERYVAGELGVLAPEQDAWELFVAWRHLAAREPGPLDEDAPAPLTADDVAALAAVPAPRQAAAGDPAPGPPAVQVWREARSRIPGVDSGPWIDPTRWVERPLPDGSVEYFVFTNCLDDAFLTAADTLEARAAAWGADSVAVAEWLRGQDRVFDNCSSGGSLPAELDGTPASGGEVPALLRQDRAYQRAAAHFYALDYAEAEARFRAIGDDADSPWQQTARYLVARTQARDGRPREAVETLRRLLDDPAQARFHDSIRGLVEHYRQRYEPEVLHRQALARLLASPLPDDLAQVWTDYRLTRRPEGEGEPGGGRASRRSGLDLWLAAMTGERDEETGAETEPGAESQAGGESQAGAGSQAAAGTTEGTGTAPGTLSTTPRETVPAAQLARTRWQASGERSWLVAALALAPGPRLDVYGNLEQSRPEGPAGAGNGAANDAAAEASSPAAGGSSGAAASTPPAPSTGPGAGEPPPPGGADGALDALLDAAGRVPVGSPADLTAAYHQGRLLLGLGWYPEVRAIADDALAYGGPDEGPLADRATSNRFSALRAQAAYDLEDFVRHSQLRPFDVGIDQGRWFEVDWSLREGAGEEPPVLLTSAAVMALNALSTRELADLARGELLHPDVGRRVLLATWTRASLLGHYDLAKELAPRVAAAEPALAQALDDFAAAPDEDLHFAAALLALRFPGLHPDLHVGLPREDPVGEIDSLRQNWWCEGGLLVTPEWFVAPPFLAAAPPEVLEQRAFERRLLAAQEPAPRHLALAVLERADTRPDDPRLPEALHRVVQATRHGCPLPEGGYGKVSRAAFQRLHQRYPDSPWTAKTPYWFD